MTTQEATNVVQCVIWYQHNTAPSDGIAAVYGNGCNEAYEAEKMDVWRKGIKPFFGSLDEDHQRRFVKLAVDKYMGQLESRQAGAE